MEQSFAGRSYTTGGERTELSTEGRRGLVFNESIKQTHQEFSALEAHPDHGHSELCVYAAGLGFAQIRTSCILP